MTKICPKGLVIQDNTTKKREAIKLRDKWKRIMGKAKIVKKNKRYYICSKGAEY